MMEKVIPDISRRWRREGSKATLTHRKSPLANRRSNRFIMVMVAPLVEALFCLAGALALWRIGVLTLPASLLAGLMAFLLLAAGGMALLAPALVFLILSSLWSRWPGRSRRDRTRRTVQVWANGGVAMLVALVDLFLDHPLLHVAVAGAFAGAAADTWATEWGRAFGGTPLCLRTLRRVPPGTSGAVSPAGTLASLFGAASIAGAATLSGAVPPASFPPILAAGFSASLVDSLLGAWYQSRWRTPAGTLTEERRKKGIQHAHAAGFRWLDNDGVNFLATATGGTLAFILTWA